ncbi:polyprenyl synthetase family protein [Bacillaceae bacterium W0354]
MNLAITMTKMNKEITLIENRIREVTRAENPMIQSASTHLLDAGGKRIRPIFVLLAAQFGDVQKEDIINVAVALELIHMASLVHDDVIDHASVRRGKPTVNEQWDNGTALYTGDFIFARTLELLKPFENDRLHQVLSNTMYELCIGEIDQIRDKFRLEQNLFTYLRRIKRKTALLIASSTEMGALAAGVDEKNVKLLKQYGYYIGMSYQIIDDILDFTSTEDELGKPVGSDLLNGNLTLPALLSLENESIYESIKNYFQGSGQADDKFKVAGIIEQIKETNIIDQAYEYSQAYLNKAHHVLEQLPNNESKSALKQIAIYLSKRTF